jgi:hypothetical protein
MIIKKQYMNFCLKKSTLMAIQIYAQQIHCDRKETGVFSKTKKNKEF